MTKLCGVAAVCVLIVHGLMAAQQQSQKANLPPPPVGVNQVSVAAFNSMNTALTVEATPGVGGGSAPVDADQVFTSIYDQANGAIHVICISGCGGAGSITLQSNGANNSSQTLLNLTAGTNISVTNTSGGNVSVAFTGTIPQNQPASSGFFVTGYNSSSGVFSIAQPSFSNVTGTCQINQGCTGATTASGSFNALAPSVSGVGAVIYSTGSNTWGALAGNNSGTNCFTESSGGAPSWQPCGTGASILWSSLTNATSSLMLVNTGYNTTFTQAGSDTWAWQNTASTSSGTVAQSSPTLLLAGMNYNGTTDIADYFKLQTVEGTGSNGSSALTLTHVGTTGNSEFLINPLLLVLNSAAVSGALSIGSSSIACSAAGALCLEEGSAPAGVASLDEIMASSSLHWPEFNPNNTGAFIVVGGPTSGITVGDCAKWITTLEVGDAGPCGGTGPGTVVASPQYQFAYYSSAGTTASVSGLPQLVTDSSGDLTTQTTVTNAVANSPLFTIQGEYQSGASSYAADKWTIQDVVGSGVNGTSTLTFSRSGSSGLGEVLFNPQVVVGGNAFVTNAFSIGSSTTGCNSAGLLCFQEVSSVGGGVSSIDKLFGSSSAHWLEMYPNNTGPYLVVGGPTTGITTGHCTEWLSATEIGDAGGVCGGTGLPSSWSVNGTTNTVLGEPASAQDAVVLQIEPSVASPTADIFQAYLPGATPSTTCATNAKCAFAVQASGNIFMLGNSLKLGANNQASASNLILYGGTPAQSYVEFPTAALNPPSAPTAAPAAGGSLPASTQYDVEVTYVNTGETTVSTATLTAATSSTCTGSGNCEILVTSPAASTNATGYNVYVKTSGGSNYFLQNTSGAVAIGTNYTMTSENTSSANPPTSNTSGGAYTTYLFASAEGSGVLCTASSTPGADCSSGQYLLNQSSIAAGSGISVANSGTGLTITATGGAGTATSLQFGTNTAITLSTTDPTNGQCLGYNGTNILGVTCGSGGGAPNFGYDNSSGSSNLTGALTGTSFTLSSTPVNAAGLFFYVNGLLQVEGTGTTPDYNWSGTTITCCYVSGTLTAPGSSANLQAVWYTSSGGGSVTWDAIGNPLGNLTLTMGTDTSTFNSTATGTMWTWQQSTAATSGANQNSPGLAVGGTMYNSGSVNNVWTIQDQPTASGFTFDQLEIDNNQMSGQTNTTIRTNAGFTSAPTVNLGRPNFDAVQPSGSTANSFAASLNGTTEFAVSPGGIGFFGQDIELAEQSSAPAGVANDDLIYGTTSHVLRTKLNNGSAMDISTLGVNSISFSTTPVLDMSKGNVQQFSCTTASSSISPTTSNIRAGQVMRFVFIQNGTTACTVTYPSNMHGGTTVGTTLSGINVQSFVVSNNGTDLYATSAGVQNMTGGTP